MAPTVLLANGLPLHRETSFKRQLELLGKFLSEGGPDVLLIGPDIKEATQAKGRVCGAILLGYHDQFGFLHDDTGYPLLLWTQLSRPVDPGVFLKALAVPLTPMTEKFLTDSMVERIGPVIPHGVDTSVYLPFPPETRNTIRKRYGIGNGFVVGTVAANTRRKRLDLVIEAFARFFHREGEGILLIKTDRRVGIDGTDLRMLAAAHGIRHKVRILEGSFDERRMAEVYNSMDLYLTLSEWEGFCIPVIEAMACGLPIVTHRVQGPGEIVPYDDLVVTGSKESFENGTKLLTADPQAAAEVLIYAYRNRKILLRLGMDARAEVIKGYDIRVVVDLWRELIKAGSHT